MEVLGSKDIEGAAARLATASGRHTNKSFACVMSGSGEITRTDAGAVTDDIATGAEGCAWPRGPRAAMTIAIAKRIPIIAPATKKTGNGTRAARRWSSFGGLPAAIALGFP